MPSLAGVAGEPDQRLVIEDTVSLNRGPKSAERAITGIVRDLPSLLVGLLEGAVEPYESSNELGRAQDTSVPTLELL